MSAPPSESLTDESLSRCALSGCATLSALSVSALSVSALSVSVLSGSQELRDCADDGQHPPGGNTTGQRVLKKGKREKGKDYAFQRQFDDKPSIIPGCPGEAVC